MPDASACQAELVTEEREWGRAGRLVEHIESLDGVRRKGTSAVPAWYVHNRLVARAESADRWIIRCPFDLRETLLREHPETFGVRPRLEAHTKVEAYPQEGDLDAMCRALDAAWEMQQAP